jgi:hypothetical protein
MPQPVLTKYKQGDLGADYPKDTPVGEKIDMSVHANHETRPDSFPKQKNNMIDKSVFKKADERDY